MAGDNIRHRVLIVDDDPVCLEILRKQLTHAGYAVMLARDAQAALEFTREGGPRLIVSDWIMPGMDGLDLCRAVRSGGRTEYVYFIMLTVYSDKQRLIEAFDAGVDDFVSKPLYEGELLARLRAGVRVIDLQDELARRTQALSEMNRKLAEMAQTDELTGLPNRRNALTELQSKWPTVVEGRQSFSCAILDIDHFKSINDTHGHDAGDAILWEIGRIVQNSVRGSDKVFRFGGDELLLLLPGQTGPSATIITERCRSAIEKHPFRVGGAEISVTVSIGAAERRGSMSEYTELVREADQALYQAKRRGRNTVHLWSLEDTAVAGAQAELHSTVARRICETAQV